MRKRASIWQRWKWRALPLGVCFFLLLGCFRFWDSSSALSAAAEEMTKNDNPANHISVKSPPPQKKIAFLFLVRNQIALESVWDRFFKGADQRLYSIYIHARPGFVCDSSNTPSSFFWNRQLNDSVQVEWGEASMIAAERILLSRALEDPAVSHFVLLSDSCIPLYSFSFIYEYITTSSKSFVDSFTESKNTRYNNRMFPIITQDKWRKGSQWFVLLREHAKIVVSDKVILQTFYDHCKRDVLPESGRKFGASLYSRSDTDCVPDEHYIQTLLAIKGAENETERRTLTYTLWKASGPQTDRWHPVTFNFRDASARLIREIQGVRSIKYETEGWTEWCSCNGVPRGCYLFARKFARQAVTRLIKNNETSFLIFNQTAQTSFE